MHSKTQVAVNKTYYLGVDYSFRDKYLALLMKETPTGNYKNWGHKHNGIKLSGLTNIKKAMFWASDNYYPAASVTLKQMSFINTRVHN